MFYMSGIFPKCLNFRKLLWLLLPEWSEKMKQYMYIRQEAAGRNGKSIIIIIAA
jgi:hypothetical protein